MTLQISPKKCKHLRSEIIWLGGDLKRCIDCFELFHKDETPEAPKKCDHPAGKISVDVPQDKPNQIQGLCYCGQRMVQKWEEA